MLLLVAGETKDNTLSVGRRGAAPVEGVTGPLLLGEERCYLGGKITSGECVLGGLLLVEVFTWEKERTCV